MEENGKKISQRTGSLIDIAKSKGSQQTQSNDELTEEQQNLKDWTKNKLQEQGILPGINQGTQTADTTTTLPGITQLQNLQESNKVKFTPDFKSNVVLPGISEPKYQNATMSQATKETERRGYQRAKNQGGVKNFDSMNEQIHDEMVSGEYIPLLKQGAIQTWNDIKKFGYRKGVELVDDIANRPYETILGGMPQYKFLAKYLDEKRSENSAERQEEIDKNMSALWKKYYKYEDKINKNFEKRVDRNMNKTVAKEFQDSGGVWESFKSGDTDMVKYGLMQGFSTSIIPMIPGIIAGFVTKNPTVTAGIAFASTAPIEDQEAYEEAMKEGATRDEAEVIGKYAGIINGILETAGEFLQLKGMLKPLKKNITKEITKKTTRQIIGRGLKEWLGGIFGEGLTEGTQELVTNSLIKTINEDKDIFEGVIDSIIVGGVLGGGGSTLGAGGKVIEDVENNKKIDIATDIEALNYVMQGEQRKAQRMQQEQREKIKERIENRRKAKTWGEVEEIDNQNTVDSEVQQTEEEIEEKTEEDIEEEMIDAVLNDEDEDIGDSKYQKNDSSQSVSKDTVSEKSHSGNITITSENSSGINQNLNGIKRNTKSLNPETFLQKLKESFTGAKGSNYIKVKINGRNYVMRISNHHANANTSLRHPQRNTSIVVKLMKKGDDGKTIKFKKNNKVNLSEFVYDPANLDFNKMNGIIDGIQNWMQTGEYNDTNFDKRNESIRKKGNKKKNNKTESGEKHQLKYEEEGYTPGVANKDEKNISGKEGIKQKNKINDQTVEQLAEKYGVKVEVIKGMIEIFKKLKNGKKIKDGEAYGKYRDQLLTLSEQIKESTAPHELLHAIFDMIDPETKTYLISQVMKSEGWNAETAEERLADSFSNFFRTGKIEGAPKSTWGRIKMFFKRVRSFINGMNKWRNELEEIFTDIITADGIVDLQSKIDESSRLNKSKERMRKRFMEYRKNAIKTQERAESENKYQKKQKDEPRSLTDIKSVRTTDSSLPNSITIDDENSSVIQKAGDINSPAFKKRFGDSKVVDENGNPLVVYHGTRNGGFTSFNKNDSGIRFSENIDVADSYAGDDNRWTRAEIIKGDKLKDDFNYEGDEGIYKVYLSIKNPLVLDYEGYGATNHPELSAPSYYLENLSDEYDGVIARNIRDEGGWNGGVNDPEERYAENTVYGVKNPNQVKSATDNVGTYDENNDDIRYQKADSDQKDSDGRTLSNGQAEYFKDSKVRDDNGNLLRVYHGTKQPEEFTVFDNSKSNGYNSNSSAHVGNRFTDSKKGAENFAGTTWAQGKPRAMEGYLNIKNPKIYETRDVTKEKAKAGENNKKLIKDMEDRLNVLGFNTKLGGYESLTGMPSLRYNDKEFMKMMGYLTSEAMVNDYKGWGGYSKLGDFVNALSKAGIGDAQIVNEAKYLHNLYNDYMNSEKKYYSIQSDAYDQYQSDISTYGDNARDAVSEYKQDLIKQGYDGIIIKNTEYDGGEFGGTNTQYVSFNSNQFKNIDNLNPTDNEDIRYQRVYHGSPYNFDKFDSSHMGEGEGAQAHGWGHYVAVDENTGRRYAQLHQGDLYSNIKYKGESSRDMTRRGIDREDVNQVAPSDIMTSIVDGISRGKYDESMKVSDIAKDIINQRIEVYSNSYERSGDWIKNAETPEEKAEMQRRADRLRDLIKAYKDLDEKDFDRPQRNLYEVEIPDPVKADTPTGKNYLEENGEITKAQMDKIYDEVVKEYEKKKQGKAKRVQNLQDGRLKTFRNLIDQAPGMLSDGKGLYSTLSNVLGGQEQASKFLESLGYDGIHYFGGRDGEAYVIFNDDALEIKNHERYQKAGDTNSEAFKKRFGDSKVVDENGNPLKVYHGTDAEFNTFGNIKTEPGYWFTEDADYAKSHTKNGNVKEVYLSIKKPLNFEDGRQEKVINSILKDAFGEVLWDDEHILSKEFRNVAKAKGYDGIIFDHSGKNTYIVFEPNQIKSATDNVGTYDANNEDIRFQKAGNTKSENFKKRFDGSKVVKENGKPQIVYHGTTAEFTVFNKIASRGIFGDGYYFTNRIGTARQYGYGRDGRVMKVYLAIKNPYVADNGDGYFLNTKKLKEEGYDGVQAIMGSETYWVAFDSNQVKSATDNVGTYDINNDDIRYQKVKVTQMLLPLDPLEKSSVRKVFEKSMDQIYNGIDYWDTPFANYAYGTSGKYMEGDVLQRQKMIDKVTSLLRGLGVKLSFVNELPSNLGGLYQSNRKKISYRRDNNNITIYGHEVFHAMMDVINNGKINNVQLQQELKKTLTQALTDVKKQWGIDKYSGEEGTYANTFAEEWLANAFGEYLAKRELTGPKTFREKVKSFFDNIINLFKNNLMERSLSKGLEKAFEKIANGEVRSRSRDLIPGYISLGGKTNDDIRYQKTEYEYDENGNRKWIKFGDNSEFDPSIFGTPTKEEQIEEDKENEKSNPFYNAWMRYNNQNYKDDQLTLGEFVDAVGAWGERKQEEFDKKKNDIAEVENDPKMLELQLKAVKLAEEETNVGKKFGKNVSKEVRDKQQAEVDKKREDLSLAIYEWMYPGLRFEDSTYEDKKSAWDKEAEWEMLGREKIEEKLKYFKKDSNGNWEKKNIKLETPQEQREKIEKSGNFDEVIEPKDRVIQWETPEGQKGRLDKAKDPKQFKKVMEKINSGKSKTKVELKDVTNEVRALERYKENERAEKERRKKEKQEEYAKKKQEEYKRNVRLKAFQRLVDMQRFEKFPFLSEEEIKQRWGFTDEEWKKITEQLDLGYPPKKRNEKAVSDFNKAVDSEVKFIIEGLSRQNKMKQKEAEKNQGEIGEIDLDVLLGKDEEKGQKEVEEFERIAKEEKKKGKKEKNKRLEQAREDVTNVEIDKERENSKSEKERVDKIIKSTKSDNTVWGRIKEFASDLITPVSTRIREISPKIYRELMRYFQNKDILTNQRLKEIDPFLKAMGKIRKENPVRFMDIRVALANRNIGYANGLLKEYGVKVPTKLLDTIYDEAEDVGLNINYLGSYYPLSVKSPKKFLEELMKVGKGDIASEIEKKIQQESQKKGGPLDESEITAIINSVIAGEEKGPDVNLGNKHLKKRNTEIERTPQMLEYCDDPISTLITYIEGMTDKIERAKFLGKSRSGNVHTLADYVYNAKNGLTPEQQDELMELLKSVFNDTGTHPAIQRRRDIATLTTLGSPSSTLTQISDLSFSIYENGWRETLKAVWDIFMKRKAFDLQDMGILNRGEEYTNINSQKNLLQKAIHNVFKMIFFSQFDTFGKSTFIQSTWKKRRKRALKGKDGDPQLRKDIMKITNDEYITEKVINDLRNGIFSEEVALVMYMKLGNIQPLTKAQMPKTYLDNPNGRLFYQFKTFGIKQLDYVLQETKGNLKGFKNLSTTEKFLKIAQVANMVFIMTLLGVGADELKDITMRRRSNSLVLRWLFGEDVGSEQLWGKMEDNVLKLFGLSRYSIMQMKNGNWDKAISDIFLSLPAMRTVDNIVSDIHKAFKNDGSINWRNPSAYQSIPVIGKYRYWIFGGGQDKQQEELDKGKKATTSGGSSRSTRTTRSNRNGRNTR